MKKSKVHKLTVSNGDYGFATWCDQLGNRATVVFGVAQYKTWKGVTCKKCLRYKKGAPK